MPLVQSGISAEERIYNQIDKVVVVKGKTPESRIYWFFHIKDKVLKVNVNRLLTGSDFRKQYIRAFNCPAPYIKRGHWDNIINALHDGNKIEVVGGDANV